jgi:hypothetical protein
MQPTIIVTGNDISKQPVGASLTSGSVADLTTEQFLLCPCSCGAHAFVGEAWIGLQTPLVVVKDQGNASIKGIVFLDFFMD